MTALYLKLIHTIPIWTIYIAPSRYDISWQSEYTICYFKLWIDQ